MSKIKLAKVLDNPYRDRNLNPTTDVKKADIKESIDQTGFWDNLLVRVRNNEMPDGTAIKDAVHLAELLDTGALDLDAAQFELAYGHHRIDVLREMNWEDMDVPVKYITDEKMIRIQANENKDGWGHGISTILETVRLVQNQLESQLADFSGFTDYQDTLGDNAIFSKKQFSDAKTQGIGYRTIQAFLGESWSQATVRVPMVVLNAISKKYFTQVQIAAVPSIGLLDAMTACIVAMYEGGKVKEKIEVPKKDKDGKPVLKDGEPVMVKEDKFVTKPAPALPMYYKDLMVAELISQCLPSAVKDADRGDEAAEYLSEITLTQAAINRRRVSMLKNQSAPTTNGTAKYRLDTQIRRDFFPTFTADAPNDKREELHAELIGSAMDAFVETEGIKGYAGLDDLVESLKTSFEVLLTPLSDDVKEENDLQAEMDQSAGDSSQFESRVGDLDITTEDIDEESGDVTVIPMGQISADTIQTLAAAGIGLDAMLERFEEVDFEVDPTLAKAVTSAITKLSIVFGKAGNPTALHGLFTDILDAIKEG